MPTQVRGLPWSVRSQPGQQGKCMMMLPVLTPRRVLDDLGCRTSQIAVATAVPVLAGLPHRQSVDYPAAREFGPDNLGRAGPDEEHGRERNGENAKGNDREC